MSFKPGRTFGGQVAGSVHRKKNWASRRKWERKGETKKPGLQALEATVTSSALADPREASVLFLFAPQGAVLSCCFLETCGHPACLGDVIRVSWSDICPTPPPLPSSQLGPHHMFPGTPTLTNTGTYVAVFMGSSRVSGRGAIS